MLKGRQENDRGIRKPVWAALLYAAGRADRSNLPRSNLLYSLVPATVDWWLHRRIDSTGSYCVEQVAGYKSLSASGFLRVKL